MIYTSQLLVFARPGSDELVDIVPFNEILHIKISSIEKEHEVDTFNYVVEKTKDGDGNATEFALEIGTVSDGYNSGRIFRIRVISQKDQQAILDDLTRLCAREQEKLQIKSKYKKMQDRIAFVIDSNMVQISLAFLITMVWLCS
jgi:hypothetical protein